jgi:uncharacterized protein (TIGR00369 family)
MEMRGLLGRLLPSVEGGDRNMVREMWDRFSGIPGGKRLFARIVGLVAPYTATIGAHVEELRMGYARASIVERHALRNPFRSVHAIALANLAELTGNLAVSYSLPDDARFIVSGLSIDYTKKARGEIVAECRLDPIPDGQRREHEILVELTDSAGDVVARATLRTLVGPKRRD